MSDDLRTQVFNQLNLRETDELVEIWQQNDRVEWTELAFDVIREILQDRIGEVPPQDEPVLEHDEETLDDEYDDESTGEFDEDENGPVFYDPQEVLWLERWLNRVAIAAIVATVVIGLYQLPATHTVMLSKFHNNGELDWLAWMSTIVLFVITIGINCLLLYFPLRALGYLLKILMEMEFNSREVE